jgi:hypothetical protein
MSLEISIFKVIMESSGASDEALYAAIATGMKVEFKVITLDEDGQPIVCKAVASIVKS